MVIAVASDSRMNRKLSHCISRIYSSDGESTHSLLLMLMMSMSIVAEPDLCWYCCSAKRQRVVLTILCSTTYLHNRALKVVVHVHLRHNGSPDISKVKVASLLAEGRPARRGLALDLVRRVLAALHHDAAVLG